MTALAAIAEIERRGVELYADETGQIILRSHRAGEPVPDDVVAMVQTHRGEIGALIEEFVAPEGKFGDELRL